METTATSKSMIQALNLRQEVADLFEEYTAALKSERKLNYSAVNSLFNEILKPLGVSQNLRSNAQESTGIGFCHEIEHILVDREFLIESQGLKSGGSDFFDRVMDEQVANLLDPGQNPVTEINGQPRLDTQLSDLADLMAEDLEQICRLGELSDEESIEILESQKAENPKVDRIWVMSWKNTDESLDLRDRITEAAHNFYYYFIKSQDTISDELARDFIATLRRAKQIITLRLRRL